MEAFENFMSTVMYVVSLDTWLGMNHAGNILHVSAEFLLRNYQCMIIKIVVMDFICINLASFSFILFIL